MLPVETEVPQLYIKMAKEVAGLIKLQIRGGAANPSPPVGPALGAKGVNIMEFCKQFMREHKKRLERSYLV